MAFVLRECINAEVTVHGRCYVRDTESDPRWGWLGLACETRGIPNACWETDRLHALIFATQRVGGVLSHRPELACCLMVWRDNKLSFIEQSNPTPRYSREVNAAGFGVAWQWTFISESDAVRWVALTGKPPMFFFFYESLCKKKQGIKANGHVKKRAEKEQEQSKRDRAREQRHRWETSE